MLEGHPWGGVGTMKAALRFLQIDIYVLEFSTAVKYLYLSSVNEVLFPKRKFKQIGFSKRGMELAYFSHFHIAAT